MSLFKRTLAALITAVLIPMATLASNVTGTIALPNTALKLSNGTISMVLSDAFGKPTSAVQAGSFVIASSTVSCYTSTDGTVVGIPNPLVAPLAAAQAASGSLSGTYYVKITYYDASSHESLVSPVSTVLVSGPNNEIVITPPALRPASATGYKIYASTTLGSETLQATQSSFTSFTLTALTSGAAFPSTNNSVCSVTFNDILIPYGTTYRTNLVDANGSQIAGFPQSWYLAGTSYDLSTGYPIAPSSLQTRFPNPVLQNPSSNAQQSVGSPVTFNGYNVTAGSLTLPNNPSPPASAVGKTVIYTDNSGVAKICVNGVSCISITALSNGWSYSSPTVTLLTSTDRVVVGASTVGDFSAAPTYNGAIIGTNFIYATANSTSNTSVIGMGYNSALGVMELASDHTGAAGNRAH